MILKQNNNISITFWESVNNTKWGNYIFEIEKKGLFLASNFCQNKGGLIEIGFDGGHWLQKVESLGWKRILGLDIESNISGFKIAKERLPNAQLWLVDKNNKTINIESNSLDLVYCLGVPPVVNSDWFYFESNRVLKKNGIIYFSTTNKNSVRAIILKILRFFGKKQSKYLLPSYTKSYKDFCELLNKNDFEILYTEGYCWFPFSRGSNSIFVPIFIQIERILKLNKVLSFSPWLIFIARKK